MKLQEFTGIYRNLQEFTGIRYKFKIWKSVELVSSQSHYPISEFGLVIFSENITLIRCRYSNLQKVQEFTGIYRNLQEFRLKTGYDSNLSLEIEIHILYTLLIDF